MRRLQTLLALVVAPLLYACGGDSTGPEADVLHGVYNLHTVNGSVLPFLAGVSGADKLELTAGVITLTADGTFTDKTTFRLTVGGQVQTEDEIYTGTYVRNPTGVVLQPMGFDPYPATITSGTMTQIFDGISLVYRK